MNSYFAPIIDWWPERDLHPAQGNRDRQKPGCYVSSQSCSKPDQTQDDSDLQLWYSTRARKYSLYAYLDTSCVEEEGAVHSKTTAAERSQEFQVQPSFRVLCCKKNQTKTTNQNPNKTTAQQDLVQTQPCLCTAVRIKQHEKSKKTQLLKFLT